MKFAQLLDFTRPSALLFQIEGPTKAGYLDFYQPITPLLFLIVLLPLTRPVKCRRLIRRDTLPLAPAYRHWDDFGGLSPL